jgi:enoyl-CoA hydratase/carnithine racemase
VFCAGFDLSACRDDPGVLGDLLSGLAAVTRAMRDHPAPMVVSAHGAALAGGCAIVAAADIAVTHESATLGYPVVRLGISPAVSAPMLRQATGDGNARVRLLDTKLVDGREALRLGLVHECVAGGDGGAERNEARAIEIARSLAEKPRHAIAWTKRWCNEIDGSLDRRSIDAALETSLSLVGSPEERELLAQVWARSGG